jgi:hypothetical protein
MILDQPAGEASHARVGSTPPARASRVPHVTKTRSLTIVAALLAALCAPAVASATTWLRPLFLKRSTYGESFTFIADLGDGSYVQLSMSVTNLGLGSTRGLCRALVIPPQAPPWNGSAHFGLAAVKWTDGAVERLSVGTCSAWVEAASSGAEVQLERGTVQLVFGERIQLISPKDSIVSVGEGRYQTEVLLYRAPVSATLTLPGQPPRDISGAGYLDHTRNTVPPKDLASRWIRFRALRGENGLLLLGREGHDGHFAPLWACRGPGRCREYRSFRLKRDGPDKTPSFRVDVVGAEEPILIRSGRLLYRDAPIENLGVAGKLVTPFTGSPVTYVYRATATDGANPPVDGILEVELSGE